MSSDLERIKQAMVDGEHTDGDLAWCVERIESLEIMHQRNVDQSKKWSRDQHRCDWRVRCEAMAERSLSALKGDQHE